MTSEPAGGKGTAVPSRPRRGFNGSHLAERQLARAAHVRIFVRCESRNDSGLIRYARVDRGDFELVFGI